MRTASAVLAAQLLLLRAVSAEDEPPSMELATRITLWSQEGCGDNFGDSSVATTDLEILRDMTQEGKKPDDNSLPCSVQSWSTDDFEKDENSGDYIAWLDASLLEDDCSLLLYSPDDMTNGTERNCVKPYDILEQSQSCTRAVIPSDIGYSYCCGGNCGKLDSANKLIGRDSLPELPKKREVPRPVEDIFSRGSSDASKSRDVTAPKRAAPLSLLNKRQGGDCSFEKKEGTTAMQYKYGEFLRVGPVRNCPSSSSAACTVTYSVQWSEMQGESFSVGAEAGFNLFEVISASVNMETTYEKSKSTTRTWQTEMPIDPGFSGYITWEPVLECVEGKLIGTDCADDLEVDTVDTDKEGEVCFIKANQNIPDGEFSNVRLS